jgi:hypothetical protein
MAVVWLDSDAAHHVRQRCCLMNLPGAPGAPGLSTGMTVNWIIRRGFSRRHNQLTGASHFTMLQVGDR